MTFGPVTFGPMAFTALTAAAARAAHPVVDTEPYVFVDSLAAPLLGSRADELMEYHRRHGDHPVLAGARSQVVARSRYAEDLVAQRRPTQYVVLGAGLDSFAYRRPAGGPLVYEVDRPDTQRDKRARVAAAGLAEPEHVRYVGVDFERDSLVASLVGQGFQPDEPAVVSWLGVTMYLTPAALEATLKELTRLAGGTEVVFDYFVPPELRDEAGRTYAEAVGAVSAERGEPWLSVCTPDELTALATACGFRSTIHIGQKDLPWLADRGDALRPSTLARLAHLSR
jgi:methyltransferase (TIGR00027 family)